MSVYQIVFSPTEGTKKVSGLFTDSFDATAILFESILLKSMLFGKSLTHRSAKLRQKPHRDGGKDEDYSFTRK
ncbi:hypothetical protein C807_03790 [Lachnospiraceae bacterium 28-4]|nr:hypothetical protein C807_03790 [Lachnospiraceae bacterium 28-4]